jgi:hypothetical protein
MLERIVAVVDNDVILLSELQKALGEAELSGRTVSEEEMLNEMIDRMLLLRQAEKFWIGTARERLKSRAEEDALIKEYMDRRIKAFIHIPHDEIEYYYNSETELSADKDFYDVRDEVEAKMIDEEMGARLREHTEELRKNSSIRVQLNGTER